MSGLVLLTEEEKASLYGFPRPPSRSRPSRMDAASVSSHSSHRRSSVPSYATMNGQGPSSISSDSAGHQGLPRTQYTTHASSPHKPSLVATASTSAQSDLLAGKRGGEEDSLSRGPILHDHSYPILRDDAASYSSTASDDQHSANRYAGTSSGLKISVTWIMVGVALGVLLGLLLGQLHVSRTVATWVSLPGELFLRALKCLVVPYVFCAVAVAIGDIVFVGKVSIVGFQTFRMFALLWISSAAIGMTVALLFRPLFRLERATNGSLVTSVGFTCANNMLLTQAANGSVFCSSPRNDSKALPAGAAFLVTDLNQTLSTTSKLGVAKLGLTEQLIAIILPVVSDNIMQTLAKGDVLSTITFAMVLGAIAGRNYFQKTRRVNYLYLTLLQLRNTFFLALEWVIWLSPCAVVSIIAGSFAMNESALSQFSRVYMYVLAGFVAATVQMLVVFPLIVFLLTRCNPYHHMSKMLRAYMFAFACSSSLATAPITLTCVKKARVCSQSLANFVISIGVCSNLSAVGWYIPIAVVFMAESSGHGAQLTVLRLIGVFVLSVLQCAGTAPIPSGVLVSIGAIYSALFGVSSLPDSFVYVTAMDFIVDRLVTVCDVNDDIMCLKVIAENTDETVTQEHLGERE